MSFRNQAGVVAWMVKNALGIILAKGGNPEKYFLSHPEFISGYFSRDAETSSA
ncbi:MULTISPECIES: hypothetical protein [unclassified Rickettsia]|uniref:hypothetical protein n=1 Tax=unclassified Rickettsia TaxID=114295 RepID=UPI0031333402